MSETEPTTPLTLIALTRAVLAELLVPAAAGRLPRIAELLDAAADAVLLGADVAPPPGAATAVIEPGLDPTIAAITLAEVTRRVGLIVAAAPQRDHPYNLARRLATLDHATRGRIGVFIAARDPSATPGSPWTTASPAEAAADSVTALRELWRSFPIDAVVGDRESGLFAESHLILAVDHWGAFSVTGPLQVPWSPQLWPPVLAWSDGPDVADVVISPGDPRFDIRRPAGLAELEQLLTADRVRPQPARAGSTLRARLGLPAAVPPTGGRPAFKNPAEKVGTGVR